MTFQNTRRNLKMDVRDLVVDTAASCGNKMLLTEVKPYFDYVNGVRSSEVAGYRYTVVLLERKFEKLQVRIAGSQQIELNEDENKSVKFDNLKMELVWSPNGYTVKALADAIKAVDATPKKG